ncbi:uncharacterized protein UTRI_02921 [Ustilago trichophora]|uniref:ArfGap-domain-containing protein n=1 Tax=Ustilago trichophora TaxID=86804 RepID=A0A5C3ENY8_9BASI|nr:uncharacterized protein UTRI_02921 [Ustilago trichophora]
MSIISVDAPAMPNKASSVVTLADTTSAHRHNTTITRLTDNPAASALQVPGHAIYLHDHQRLSVLSVNIDATTTITTSRAIPSHQQPSSPSAQLPATSLHPPSPNRYPHASTSQLHPPQPPPPPSSFNNNSSRSRPLSHDLGQKARDALNEFGRLASRTTSAIERANGAQTLATLVDALNNNASTSQTCRARHASLQPSPLHHPAPPSYPTASNADNTSRLHLASDDAVVIRSRAIRNFSLLPQRDPRFVSHTVPLRIESRVSSPAPRSSFIPSPVEFIAEPAVTVNSPTSASSVRSTFDPTRMLLKLRPPAELARDSWSQSAAFLTANNASQYDTAEEHAINLRFRLRLCATGTTPTSPSFPRTERGALSSAEQRRGQVLFLSAASPDKLADAIESPQSSIATSELASLEGISRVEVVPPTNFGSSTVSRGARDCDFDWTWKSLTRTSLGNGSRCCCAFVEMRPDGKTATLLAAMSVYIELPSPVAAHSSLLSSTDAPMVSEGGLSRSDSLALIAALNLDQDLSPRAEPKSLTTVSRAVSGAGDPTLPSQPPQHVEPLPLLIDRTELALSDLINDSPIFRAAVANLERRTASMKKASKTVLRAAQETRTRILRLIEAEEAMDAAFESLAVLAPETLGRLQDQFLRHARGTITQHRREQAKAVETCIERPLTQIAELCRVAQEGFKLFENESKTYYSQTQKWLANRSNADAPPTALVNYDGPSAFALERTQKLERADEKQKLRELRFEQARLDLYAMLQRLHGGRAEANLTQSILQLSQWLADLPNEPCGPDWTLQEQKAGLSSLDAGLRVALDDHALQLGQIEAHSRRLGDKIRSLEHALGKTADADADIVGAHRFEMEQEAPQPQPTNGAVASKARKFKSFLGAFAAGINNSPLNPSKGASPNPEAAEFHKQGELFAANGSEQLHKRRLSLKLKSDRGPSVDAYPSSPSKSQAPSSWRNQYDNMPSTPRRGSKVQDSTRIRIDDAPDQLAAGWRGSPSAARTASDAASSTMAGQEQCEFRDADKGLGIFAPVSPTTARVTDRGAAFSSATPSAIPGSERKKEGVLWVSTKAITGPAGADAPRGVNRAAHWRECWVVLSGSGQISEFADWKNAKALEPTNPLIDLRFATVREARGVDRRFAFEIVTRDSRRFFQAPDEDTMRDWMRAISKAIESLFNGTSSVRKLDRAVRASPFRNLDPAQRAGTFDENEEEPGAGEGNDFAVRRLLDRTGKGFSQSMTDLSASAKAQGGDRKDQPKLGGHLATLSESHAESSARSSKRRSRHERGISNKTPISGYLGAGGLGLSSADAAALHGRDGTGISDDGSTSSMSAHGEPETEFDRQIEAVIHRSYGSHDDTSNSGFSHNSANHGVDEMGKLKGSSATSSGPARDTSSTLSSKGRSAVNGSVASTATSTKMSRSAEVAAISRQPENRRCADCQDGDPRWASWMLANEPCCIFICIGCSGVHRSLGVHISKVKSVDLDDWTEEQVQAARDWGNDRANAMWEHSKPAGLLPSPGDRKDFWRIKYVEQKWKAPQAVREEATPSVSRTDPVVAVGEDVDATPTRRSMPMVDAMEAVVSPDRKGQSHAKSIGLRITPGDAPVLPIKLVEGLGSPRPNGPRPLPNRRSVSMQSVPTNSPPHSPVGPEQLCSIDAGLSRSPVSPSKRDPFPHRSDADRDDDLAPTARFAIPRIATNGSPQNPTSHIPTSTSVPHLTGMPTPHVSKAMLAARADPRLFPPPCSTQTLKESPASASSPPSSYFVSNLAGPSPSPIFFENGRTGRGEDVSSDTDTDTDDAEGEDSSSLVNVHPPARFDAFSS